MLSIKLLSDLHMEGFPFYYTFSGEDVLVLAGDIHTRNRLHLLLDQIPQHVRVLFVAGNHEYYHSIFQEVNEYFCSLEEKYTNFKFLNNSFVQIGDVHFFGGTMFTQFELYGIHESWFAKQAAANNVNDFHVILKYDDVMLPNLWTTEDHEKEHHLFRRELSCWLSLTEGQKRVVISHFAPHMSTVALKYGRSATNAYFTENMDEFMGWEGVWCYGHTHDCFDRMVGDTRLIANAKGYGDECRFGFNPELLIDI